MPVSLMQQSIPKQFVLLLAEVQVVLHQEERTGWRCCWQQTSWAGAEWTSTTSHPSFLCTWPELDHLGHNYPGKFTLAHTKAAQHLSLHSNYLSYTLKL
eukprot:1314060-Rhodomonas_salina.1